MPIKIRKKTKKKTNRKTRSKYATRKINTSNFLYNPRNPLKAFDVYIDKDPSDTIPIRYKTEKDVQQTIQKLERLYKSGKYPHKRIWQVAMIMKVRLEVLKKDKPDQYKLAKEYMEFLSKRTQMNESDRRKSIFKYIY
jgi:hypothetical protein